MGAQKDIGIKYQKLPQRKIVYKNYKFHIKKGGHNVPVGIKNSWKYEKDLIILNENKEMFTISRPDRS